MNERVHGIPPRFPVDLDDLAGMLSVIAGGGIILSKVVHDKNALPRQVLLYRDFLRAVFQGPWARKPRPP